jgi:hypothetical protein
LGGAMTIKSGLETPLIKNVYVNSSSKQDSHCFLRLRIAGVSSPRFQCDCTARLFLSWRRALNE